MSVTLRNPRTGETKIVPEGWCWGCCLFSGFLGMPLYRRGLQVWGSLMVAFNIIVLVVSLVPTERADRLYLVMSVIGLGLSVFFGAQANQMALDRYLAMGWVRADQRRNSFSA
jgi:hypothetical protein